MQLVIDSNQLQNSNLKAFLRNSKNRAVLPDFSAMEAYKGDTLNSIFKSMEIVSEFPDQIIILKGSTKIGSMSGKTKGLQRRLIDESQTAGFPKFVKLLRHAQEGDLHLREQLLKLGKESDDHFAIMLEDAKIMGEVFNTLGKVYTKEERAILRKQLSYSPEMLGKLIDAVLPITNMVFKNTQKHRRFPSMIELPNTFIFRFSLACYIMAITRTAHGGVRDVKPEKLRNDLVDMILVTYGTYFDGILSDDKNVNILFTEICLLLSRAFGARVPAIHRAL